MRFVEHVDAVVTGGASGIGSATLARLAEEGAPGSGASGNGP